MEDIAKYLERINFTGPLRTDTETLKNLQLSHLLNVPFENLSIHLNEPIILNYELLFNKIVHKRRGGFCYELNGLFYHLLCGLGFDTEMLSAGVAKPEGGYGRDFDHMALLVTLQERWLVDVGFGDSFTRPLLVDRRDIQSQGERDYRIEDHGDYLLLKESKPGSGWEEQYRFKLRPVNLNDFEEMCHYHQTSPESTFTQKRVCSKAMNGGRITLTGTNFIETINGERREMPIKDDAEYRMILQENFGISL